MVRNHNWSNNVNSRNVSRRIKGRQTNNSAEIEAAIEAAEIVAERTNADGLVIHSDSRFLQDCWHKFIHKWRRNGWVNQRGETLPNIDELQRMDQAFSHFEQVTIVINKIYNYLDMNFAHCYLIFRCSLKRTQGIRETKEPIFLLKVRFNLELRFHFFPYFNFFRSVSLIRHLGLYA